jgi:ubiquinone/menaquinone biosynthesis C-methylase UbiE
MSKKIIREILLCPSCKNENMILSEEKLICGGCGKEFKSDNGKIFFNELESGDISDNFDRIKHYVKKYSKFYDLLISIFSPVYVDKYHIKFIKKYCSEKNIIALNLGSGNSDLSENVSNVDLFNYPNVNLVCNIENLPLKDNSCDIILNIAVLEHVQNPEKIVAEIYRVLKKGGLVFSSFPFIQGYHASPFDFSRRTVEGIKYLYKDFEPVEVKVAGGPASGFLWIFQEFVALILSFGIKKIHNLVLVFLMLITFPVKYLDIVLRHFPVSENISSAFYYIGKKN